MTSKKKSRKPERSKESAKKTEKLLEAKKRWPKKPYGVIAIISMFLFLSFFLLKDLPSAANIADSNLPQSTTIYDRHGKLLYAIYASKNRSLAPLSKIPKHLQYATVAIEDKDFYKHGAIDVRGIARATFFTIFKGQVQGGSTLTQQLVKNSILTPERTLTRKIKEVFLSFIVELVYRKDKILEMYLNYVPYGGTAWGVEAASQVYFEKSVAELNLAESALLAGMPSSPSLYSPFGARPELAKKRQLEVLRKMREQGYISQTQEREAATYPLVFSKVPDKIRAPHFVFYVKELLVQKYGEKMVEQGGLNVTTSLDLETQTLSEKAVVEELKKIGKYNVSNGASLVTNPKTGEILAMVGSRDYFDVRRDGNVNVTVAKRQPGSSIKPINYAVGLMRGYTAATPFVDSKTCFPNPDGKPPYCPVNYDGKYHGVVQMRFALGSSFNIPAVKMLKLNGVEAMIATASAMGIKTFDKPDRYGLSLTLGGGEVTMLDMAEAFGVFANSGQRVELHPILKVADAKGKVLEEYKHKSTIFEKRVLPSSVAFVITHILLDNNARTLAFGEYSPLRIRSYPIAVKTGTTNDLRDNWTIGYTSSYVVASWVGNNDNSPMRGIVSGVTGAAPIWHTIMEDLVKKNPPSWPKQPENVIGLDVCITSGLLPPPEGTPDRCPIRHEFFIKGTEPTQTDPGRQKVWIDKATGDLAKAGQTDNVEEKDEIVVTDPTGDRYCLTCPHPNPEPTTAPNP